MFGLFSSLLKREWILVCRQLRSVLSAGVFFLMIISLMPLLVSFDIHLMHLIAPGMIWIAVVLALFLSSEHLFTQDYHDGVVEQWLISHVSLSTIVLAKIAVHWFIIFVAFLILSPIIAAFYFYDWTQWIILIITLGLATPSLFFLCALAAVLTTGLKQSGLLMSIIVLPLTIPVLIFGSIALMNADLLSNLPYWAILLSFSLFCLAIFPGLIAILIRLSLAD